MSIHNASHGECLAAALKGYFLHESADVGSSDRVGQAITQFWLNVLPENPVKLFSAPLFALNLLSQIDLIEFSNGPEAFGSFPLRSRLPGYALALWD